MVGTGYKGFKKVEDNKDTATLAHENGHKITIVKKGLSGKLKKELSDLPLHQAEGSSEPIQAAGDNASVIGQDSGLPDQVGTAPASQPRNILSQAGPEGSSPAAPANAAPVPPPVDPNADINALPGGPERLKASELEAKGITDRANAQAKTAGDFAKEQQDAATQTRFQLAGVRDNIDNVTKDILNNHINPNQYLENMSTGKKISTAIGLVLGGMGAATAGGSNPAMDFLNKQIERNLQAQQANISNKHNLLSALERQYGDKMTAANMFRAIDANVMASKMEQAGLQSQGTLANAGFLKSVGDLKYQAGMFQRTAQLSNLRASVRGTDPGMGKDARAEQFLQHADALAAMGDPNAAKMADEFRKMYVPGVGEANVPLTPEDRKELEARTNLLGVYDDAQNYMKNTDRHGLGALPFGKEHAVGSGLQSQMLVHSGVVSGLQRYTPVEDKIYREGLPDLTGTHFSGADQGKLDILKRMNDAALDNFFKQKGIPMNSSGLRRAHMEIKPTK